jgi:hypothetical protein
VGEEPESSALQKLISVPGLVVMGVLGVAVTALGRLFGPEHLLREVLTEVVASFGSTMLVLAVFGLLFKSGLERLLRGAPGGEALAQAAERHKDVLQDVGDRGLDTRAPGRETTLDRIGEDVRSLLREELPALRKEVAELRKLLESLESERGN